MRMSEGRDRMRGSLTKSSFFEAISKRYEYGQMFYFSDTLIGYTSIPNKNFWLLLFVKCKHGGEKVGYVCRKDMSEGQKCNMKFEI